MQLQKDIFLVNHRNCQIENVQFLNFSQKRYTGFRNVYEFEQKRVLVANDHQLKILSYHPNDLAKGVRLTRNEDGMRGQSNNGYLCLPDPTEQSNAMLLCCGGTYSNNRQDMLEAPNSLNNRTTTIGSTIDDRMSQMTGKASVPHQTQMSTNATHVDNNVLGQDSDVIDIVT